MVTEADRDSRISSLKELRELEHRENLDVVQKAKVRWSIEGDENSKYFHGILTRKQR